jgi:hypothetical protein
MSEREPPRVIKGASGQLRAATHRYLAKEVRRIANSPVRVLLDHERTTLKEAADALARLGTEPAKPADYYTFRELNFGKATPDPPAVPQAQEPAQ